MNYIELIGYLAAMCSTIAYIPQLVKIIETKSVSSISISMYLIMTIGCILWLIYGLLIESIPLIISSSITILFVVTILFFKIKWR